MPTSVPVRPLSRLPPPRIPLVVLGSHSILGARVVEHGCVGKQLIVEGDDVLASRVSNVSRPVLNRSLAGGESLHVAAHER